ncbi:PREDICTED: ras suppressor protein 1 [Hipposideros armiger]|uniref:Ras suppressor protein 1 n=1 Tax=Hipposideros armiger TaxID=186990 RepID=A0A8B7SW59_HIPAR|nr:PREDICTED: ras suppressor protein 1 [Hipposideros armiger]
MSKSLKKLVEESREKNQPEVDMSDRGISNMLDVNGLFTLSHITQLVLSHNKLTTVPPNIAELKNLEVLNFFNNQIEEHMQANPEPPKKNNDKSKKISRKPLTAKNK